MSAPPPEGYQYEVMRTVDQNTGRVIWIVYLAPTFWNDYGRTVTVTVITGVLGFIGLALKTKILAMLTGKVARAEGT